MTDEGKIWAGEMSLNIDREEYAIQINKGSPNFPRRQRVAGMGRQGGREKREELGEISRRSFHKEK